MEFDERVAALATKVQNQRDAIQTEEAAKNQLAKLNQQGVHSARIGVRSISGSKMMFQLRNLDATSKARLDQIKVNFPSQEVRSCT